MHTNGPSRGVYILANDYVIDLVIAFLNSFRKYNPDIALTFIPFNDASERVLKLAERYRFDVYDDVDKLRRCDAISANFFYNPTGGPLPDALDKRVCGAFRKLVCWDGPYEEFLYIDVDTVVLKNVDFAFSQLADHDFVTTHSNIPEIVKWVWKDSIHATGKLTPEQIAYGANTGFIASRRGLLGVEAAEKKLEAALELAPHMELLCMEQPLLNYLFVTSGLRYSSLLNAHYAGTKNLYFEYWGGNPLPGTVENGQIVAGEALDGFLVHWAGSWRRPAEVTAVDFGEGPSNVNPEMLNGELWRYYRTLGLEASAVGGK